MLLLFRKEFIYFLFTFYNKLIIKQIIFRFWWQKRDNDHQIGSNRSSYLQCMVIKLKRSSLIVNLLQSANQNPPRKNLAHQISLCCGEFARKIVESLTINFNICISLSYFSLPNGWRRHSYLTFGFYATKRALYCPH